MVAEAHGGTLFLDKVDTLSSEAQVTLLRFLQDQRYRPLGSSRELVADVRIVAATSQPLADATEEGRFRRDLMYRLNILHVQLPPLRERAGDAERLAQHFVATLCVKCRLPTKAFDADILAWIGPQSWPGNVRELESWVRRELLMSDGPTIRPMLGGDPARPLDDACFMAIDNFQRAKADAMRRLERDYLLTVLRQTRGNVTRAAQLAGKERRAFGKLLKKHGIDRQAWAGQGEGCDHSDFLQPSASPTVHERALIVATGGSSSAHSKQ